MGKFSSHIKRKKALLRRLQAELGQGPQLTRRFLGPSRVMETSERPLGKKIRKNRRKKKKKKGELPPGVLEALAGITALLRKKKRGQEKESKGEAYNPKKIQ